MIIVLRGSTIQKTQSYKTAMKMQLQPLNTVSFHALNMSLFHKLSNL